MSRNITLSIPDDLASEMDKLKEVNWSAVAREAIETYLRHRRVPNIGPIVERLAREKKQIYMAGWQEGNRLAQKVPYTAFDALYTALQSGSEDSLVFLLEKHDLQVKGDLEVAEYRRGLLGALDELRQHF